MARSKNNRITGSFQKMKYIMCTSFFLKKVRRKNGKYKNKSQIKEFDNFSVYEKKVLYSILIDGIASIYVDNEYLNYSDIGTKYKQNIIQELLSFYKYITKYSKEKVFMLYTKEVKKYRMKGFTWDNIPY
ncbi:MAG: hypothetical protein J6K42_03965 [Clostridia bacterium]|nr:hypothetical protein [Clostridia bacterium]